MIIDDKLFDRIGQFSDDELLEELVKRGDY